MNVQNREYKTAILTEWVITHVSLLAVHQPNELFARLVAVAWPAEGSVFI